ncbi:hypothetical protein QBC35DRAFT_507005 [Podospora australis]|uniref:Enoyl reductase (ER) domain-containing protein n=1 Tax=Podospora australis TaxID=1536484 RepID=A0AAN6WPD8_9PEZI|nr:hypothetical protein QBC35DRAFT_507005 [Podospora australis]
MSTTTSTPGPSPKGLYLNAQGKIEIITTPDSVYHSGNPALVPIKVSFSAIQPADLKHYHMGFHSHITGYDFAGTNLLEETSVMGFINPGHSRPLFAGAHQQFLLAEKSNLWARPADMSEETAAAIPIALMTAADAVVNCLGFAFPKAGVVSGTDGTGKAVLIWGGGSSVGWAAVQLAREAGIPHILVVASGKNHSYLKEIGATHLFDYRSGGQVVVQQVKDTIETLGVELSHIFDAVGSGLGIFEPEDVRRVAYGESSPSLGKLCLSGKTTDHKLACALPVLQDSDWQFALFSRKWGDGETKFRGWWERQENVFRWFVENHKSAWRPLPKVRVVQKATEAVQALEESYGGKLSLEKVLVRHPML